MSSFLTRNQNKSMNIPQQQHQMPTAEQMKAMAEQQEKQMEAAKLKDRVAQRTICLDLAQKTHGNTTATEIIETATKYFAWMTEQQ